MTNEQLAVLLISLWRECNQSIAQVDLALRSQGYSPEDVITVLLPMRGFSDMLRFKAEMLQPTLFIEKPK